jgi:hypothetical protein
MNHPAVLIVIFFFLNQKSEPKIVKPKSIGESILDGLKDLARWVGDKIKELLEIQVRERSWVLFKFIVKELTRPILIIAALGCWVVIYAAGVSCYLIQFSGYSCFWNFESADFFALLVQAFGKPFKSNLILGLYRSASVFLLVLVVFFKNCT